MSSSNRTKHRRFRLAGRPSRLAGRPSRPFGPRAHPSPRPPRRLPGGPGPWVQGVQGALLAACCLLASPAWAGGGPRLTVEGRGVLTTKVTQRGHSGQDVDWHYVDAADTHLTLRLDQALFSDAIGGIALGGRITDGDSPVGPVYLYQAALDVSSEHVAFVLGRTRRPMLGVSFPTLRDEDLLTFLYPLNPYSVGRIEEDVLFSEIIAVTYWYRFRWHAQVYGEALRATLDSGDPAERDRFEPNAGGIRLYYDELPSLAKVKRLKHVGLSLHMQRADGRLPDVDRPVLWQLQGTTSVGLFPDPIHLLDFRLTVLYQHGLRDREWTERHHSWWGQYIGGAAALRYLWAPAQMDRLQASVTFGYRRYLDRDAWELRVMPTFPPNTRWRSFSRTARSPRTGPRSTSTMSLCWPY